MKIQQLLSVFNLSDKEQQVYLLLSQHEWLTVLIMAKRCSIKRTTLYRIIESLIHKGLVEIQVDDKTTYYRAADPKNFESLVLEQESKANQMRINLGLLQSQLSLMKTADQSSTSVRFYRGKRGIQAMEWKMCETPNTETLIFGNSQWDKIVGREFAEKIRQEQLRKKIIVKEVINPSNTEPIPKDGIVPWTNVTQFVKKLFNHRVIEKKTLNITNEVMIGSETVSLYSFQRDEIVGIEIKNSNFAQQMKQLFYLAWKKAKVIDSFGGKN